MKCLAAYQVYQDLRFFSGFAFDDFRSSQPFCPMFRQVFYPIRCFLVQLQIRYALGKNRWTAFGALNLDHAIFMPIWYGLIWPWALIIFVTLHQLFHLHNFRIAESILDPFSWNSFKFICEWISSNSDVLVIIFFFASIAFSRGFVFIVLLWICDPICSLSFLFFWKAIAH